MDRLSGKVAVITGGGSGLGEAMSRRFADEGAAVVLTDRNVAAGEAVAADITKAVAASNSGSASFMAQDVRSADDWARIMDDAVALHGGVDILVNNAGVFGTGGSQNIEDMTLEEWRFVQEINLEGVFLGCQAAIKPMKVRGGGSIVNISSIAGLRGTKDLTAYGASKGGVRQLTKSVALHCGRSGYRIRCNSVHPGMVPTPLGEDVLVHGWGDLETGVANRTKAVPLGELGTPDDVAWAALFLASDESRHVTGSELVVDGGAVA
ncbi:MAG: glucose 1-dehydrogenase [Alphaproteobacteria bacterium]|jgi:3(or 17)beta-hydroxysteroid dehydrogenase